MRKVVILGAFPPPFHGSSIVTQEIFKILKNEFIVNKVNSSLSKTNKDIGRVRIFKFVHMLDLCFKCIVLRGHNTIYWCPAPNGWAFLKDTILFILLKLFSKSKTIIHIHARGFEIDPYWLLSIKRRVLKESKVFCVSEDMKCTLKNSFNSNYYCVWNPVLLKPNLKHIERNLDVLFVGNMFRKKGPLEFIEIVKTIKEEYPNILSAMVGAEADIPFVEIKKRISDLNLEDNIKFMGPVDHAKLSEIYLRSKILIFPSVYDKESFGLVVAEAMTFGTPSVIYGQWGVRNLIDNGVNGYICEAKDNEAIVTQTKFLLGNDDHWASMSKRCRLIAHERFSLKKYKETILTLVNATG